MIGPLADGGEDPVERARRFREETREPRVLLAAELERRYRRKVSWGSTAAASGCCSPP